MNIKIISAIANVDALKDGCYCTRFESRFTAKDYTIKFM